MDKILEKLRNAGLTGNESKPNMKSSVGLPAFLTIPL